MERERDENPKVTIITACRNSADTIEQTILSVINQTYSNLEYIIIDGASTDDTIEIIKRYEHKISFWISEPDTGLYDAYNKGIGMATGDIIGTIDSNDWYALDAVEKAVSYIEAHNVSWSYGDLITIDVNGVQEYCRGDRTMHRGIAQWFDFPTVFAKKELYEKYCSFDLQYKIFADMEWMLRIRCHNVPCCYVPHVMAYYRMNGLSSIPQHTHTHLKESKRIFHRMGEKFAFGSKAREKIKQVDGNFREYLYARYLTFRVIKYQFAKRFLHELLRIKEKNCFVMWGAGAECHAILPLLKKISIMPRIFVDEDRKKQGKLIEEIMILSKENVAESDFVIISSNKFFQGIKQNLRDMGKEENRDFMLLADLKSLIVREYVHKFMR